MLKTYQRRSTVNVKYLQRRDAREARPDHNFLNLSTGWRSPVRSVPPTDFAFSGSRNHDGPNGQLRVPPLAQAAGIMYHCTKKPERVDRIFHLLLYIIGTANLHSESVVVSRATSAPLVRIMSVLNSRGEGL